MICLKLHWTISSLLASVYTLSVPSLKFQDLTWHLKVKVKSLSRVQLFAIPWTIACQAPPESPPWDSPGKNTGVGCHFLLQGIFPTQGSDPGLLHCRQILYQLSLQGSPRILEWVAYPFSSGSSQPRNWKGVSWIAGGFFIPEPPEKPHLKLSFEVNTTYKQKQAWWMLNLWRRKWVVLIGCSRLFSMVLT